MSVAEILEQKMFDSITLSTRAVNHVLSRHEICVKGEREVNPLKNCNEKSFIKFFYKI